MELSIGLMAKSVGHSRRTCRVDRVRGRRHFTAVIQYAKDFARYLSDVHAGITGQGASGGQVVAAEHRGDDPVEIHFPDHRPVHKINQTVSISGNP